MTGVTTAGVDYSDQHMLPNASMNTISSTSMGMARGERMRLLMGFIRFMGIFHGELIRAMAVAEDADLEALLQTPFHKGLTRISLGSIKSHQEVMMMQTFLRTGELGPFTSKLMQLQAHLESLV